MQNILDKENTQKVANKKRMLEPFGLACGDNVYDNSGRHIWTNAVVTSCFLPFVRKEDLKQPQCLLNSGY